MRITLNFALIFLAITLISCVRSFDNKSFHDSKNMSGRFTVNKETVLDNATGLMWQKGVVETKEDWEFSNKYCENLDIDGYSNWRLPTINELRTLIKGCSTSETGGSCNVADDCNSSICKDSGKTSIYEKNFVRKCYCPEKSDSCFWNNQVWGSKCVQLISSVEKTFIKESHSRKVNINAQIFESGSNNGWYWYISFHTAFFNYAKNFEDYHFKCVRDI